MEEKSLVAYVDGSYDVATNRYAYGCVLLGPDGEITDLNGKGDDPEVAKIRNVAGEMLGAMKAIQFAVKNGFNRLILYYDYMGIEMWATGQWKTKNEYTKGYAEYVKKMSSHISIEFKKVVAHTGVEYNERADRLAKAALNEE